MEDIFVNRSDLRLVVDGGAVDQKELDGAVERLAAALREDRWPDYQQSVMCADGTEHPGALDELVAAGWLLQRGDIACGPHYPAERLVGPWKKIELPADPARLSGDSEKQQ